MKSCTICGRENQDDATLCAGCHADLSRVPAAGPSGTLETSGMAIASLVCGLLFLILPAAILAVVFGHIARSRIRESTGRLKGAGMALTGLILGYLGVSLVPILIVAAIAIPNLLRSKIAANEASAVGSLRTINVAALTYAVTYGTYPPVLLALGPPAPGASRSASGADLIDSNLAAGQKSGYRFTYSLLEKQGNNIAGGYTLRADPVAPGTTGQRHFFTDRTGVIRVEKAGPADGRSPPLI